MPFQVARNLRRIRSFLRAQLLGPQILAFLPALTLAAYWVGGETALLVMALIVPGLFAFGGLFGHQPAGKPNLDSATRLPMRIAAIEALDDALPHLSSRGRSVAALAVAVDNFTDAVADLDSTDHDEVLSVVAGRLASQVRERDVVARIDGSRFAIALTSIRKADHSLLVGVANRLQEAVREPISVAGQRVHLTLSVGFCLPTKLMRASGDTMIEAAEAALAAARSQGGGAVRSFDNQMPKAASVDRAAIDEVVRGLENGEIQPWFQPQVAARDGRIVGFEALARWVHPKRGTLLPADFLPLMEPAGQSRRLGEVMLYGAFSLLRNLDRLGIEIPSVAVNMSHAELAAPDLADRLKWEMDRFDLSPERLSIEVLETAIARDTTTVEQNLRAIAKLGCNVDLDDFGTGNTSIAGIRRFAVTRLKIDRSFVTRVDCDSEQKDMVRAIQTMADQLHLQTIAEGVETIEEQAALVELGCDMIQGFVLARPMPAEEVEAWTQSYLAKIGQNATGKVTMIGPQRERRGKTA